MPSLLRMPTPAAGVEEATLLEWSIEEGAAFAEADELFVIETDKAVIDVEAEVAGVLHRKLIGGGRQVEVGTPVAVIGAAGDSEADIEALIAEAGITAAAIDDAPAAGAAPASPGDDAPAIDDVPAAPAADTPDRGSRIFASPIARLMAKNAALDLSRLVGTGPDGRIVRRDVAAAIAAAPAEAPTRGADTAARGGVIPERTYTDEPHSRIRRAIATRLTESKQTVPHFYLRGSARVDALLALRAELNVEGAQKISVNDLIVRAVARAHLLSPAMNATYLPDAIRHFDYVDIAVAVATDGGLVTPVIRDVDRLPISAIAATTADYAARARSGRLRQHELDGGTITVTNLGMFGTEEFAAIINPPHSAILAVGAARKEPVVDAESGDLVAATVMHLVVSVDHRALDGVIAAQWLGVLVDLLEHPARILA